MQYALTIRTLDSPGSVELSEDEFNAIRDAKQDWVRLVTVEEKLDFVLDNYKEFELELLDITLNRMVHLAVTWRSGRRDTQRVNRRIANLLSACRSYFDHVEHIAMGLVGRGPEVVEALRAKRRLEYESKRGYRFMESLRSYTQHRNFPVHLMEFPGSWEQHGEAEKLVFRLVPSLKVSLVLEDKKIKPAIREELGALETHVPLTPLVREYVEGLAEVHSEFRTLTSDRAEACETTLRSTVERSTRAFCRKPLGLEIVAWDGEGLEVGSEWIVVDLLEYRRDLLTKNGSLKRLSDRFVSGDCAQ